MQIVPSDCLCKAKFWNKINDKWGYFGLFIYLTFLQAFKILLHDHSSYVQKKRVPRRTSKVLVSFYVYLTVTLIVMRR